ncbi:MAG: DEAD/DEAH box helicase, partial [Propionibacteriaceae bacterium]
ILPDGSRVSHADYTYGYGEALADHVVRPVIFMAYGGHMRWRTKAGDELEAHLAEPLTKDLNAQAWRTALDPKGEWMSAVLRAADTRLTEVRRHIPDAGGLVIASDQTKARAYAKVLHALTGDKPTVVLSDDAAASSRIEQFTGSDSRWMVAVRMVSEGVDVPRLAVGVYATSVSTPLFFAQAVGRFVRTRRRGEVATVFLPTVPIILAHASMMEKERNHVLGAPKHSDGLWAEDELIAQANREEKGADYLEDQWEALDSSASFDHVLFDAQAYGLQVEPNSQEEADWLGLPGLLEPDQVAVLLAERQRRQLKRQDRRDTKEKVDPDVAMWRALEKERKQLNSLVAQYARAKGQPFAHIHAELRRQCGGPPLARATEAQVKERIERLRQWLFAA